jgi:endonuclease/exonuclease/phosphatase (EEP) superfamily protein YafD
VEVQRNETDSKPAHQHFFSLGLSLWGLLSAGTMLACVGTMTGFFGGLWWPLELTSHFRVQCFLFLAVGAVIYLIGKKYRATIVAGIFAIPNLVVIMPIYFGSWPAVSEDAPRFRAVLMNVSIDNDQYDRVGRFIRSVEPTFVIIEEVNAAWLEKLPELLSDFPHSISRPRPDEFGMALFSKVPFEHAEIIRVGRLDFPGMKASMVIGGRALTVIGIHPPPPIQQEYVEERRRQMQDLAGIVRSLKGPVMVLGDLNTTSWSPIFRELLTNTGLRDSRQGFGIQASWPTHLPHLLIPVDHCLVSRSLAVRNRQIGPRIGSDHFPIIVDVVVSGSREPH